MSYIAERKTGSSRRFMALLQKSEIKRAAEGFELTKADPFLDGHLDILDILAFRDKQERTRPKN